MTNTIFFKFILLLTINFLLISCNTEWVRPKFYGINIPSAKEYYSDLTSINYIDKSLVGTWYGVEFSDNKKNLNTLLLELYNGTNDIIYIDFEKSNFSLNSNFRLRSLPVSNNIILPGECILQTIYLAENSDTLKNKIKNSNYILGNLTTFHENKKNKSAFKNIQLIFKRSKNF